MPLILFFGVTNKNKKGDKRNGMKKLNVHSYEMYLSLPMYYMFM